MKRFLFLIGCLFSTLAMASNWQLAYFTDRYDVFFYDLDSVEKTSTNRIQVWTALVLYRDRTFPILSSSPVNLFLSLREFDTKKRMYRDLQLFIYKDGRDISEGNGVTKWSYLVPGTFADDTYKMVLGKQKSSKGNTQGNFGELVKFGREKAKVAMLYEAIIQNNIEQQQEKQKQSGSKSY